jgi:hypothetical protein
MDSLDNSEMPRLIEDENIGFKNFQIIELLG